MDRSGKTIASSNRNAPDSFMGKNYGFRPYFKQAMNGNTGRYFAVGVTSKASGYYVSRPVRAKGTMAVAVVKVSLQNVTQELQAAGQKGNSLICLADPRGVVFLGSQPEMILKSLWPVDEKDLASLKDQYGKDQFPAIFPTKIGDGSKVVYQGKNYLASFAGTIHAGWSVFFLRSVEMVGGYRLTGIAVAGILAILAMIILGSNFYFKEQALASTSRFQAMFDAAPEAIGVIDPDTLQIMEANRSLASCLGFSQKELHTLQLEKLLNQDPRKIRHQLQAIILEDGGAKMAWQAHKKDGSVLDLEVMGSKLEHQGKEQVLIYCREAEALQLPPTAILQENSHFSQVREPRAPSLIAASTFSEAPEAGRAIFPVLEEQSPTENGPNFDHEAKVHIKRIMEALNKAEKLRKNSGDLQKL
jgi:PAS domain S-box-containing protein